MSSLRIKPCHLSDIDNTSLRSMLKLSDSRLNTPWEITEQGPADLYVYSLSNNDSEAAWQQHNTGFSAILSTEARTIESADIVLKKPLRAKNFADALNQIEQKVIFANQAQQVAKINQQAELDDAAKPQKSVGKHASSFLSSLSSNLSKHLNRKKSPVEDLPSLQLYVPEASDAELDSILEPELLKQWLDDLAENDSTKIVSALLANLTPLNRAEIPANTRIALLDIYRAPISKLIFDRDLKAIKREMHSPTEFQKDIKALNLLLEELALGYKIIINEAYQHGERPSNNDSYLLAIIRAAELISLAIIHTFRHYRSAPTGALHNLHQLYLYCEASHTLDKTVTLKTIRSEQSFFQCYSQIMLTCIADPYSLAKFDVFRLYKLMAKMADKVEIKPLTENQKNADNSFAIVGNFYIDCSSDRPPAPLSNALAEQRQRAETRTINPQGVLQDIERVFQAAAATTAQGAYDLDIQLLKKVIPQFNTTYERKYQRITTKKNRKIYLADGIPAIHHGLQDENSDQLFEWMMSNQGSGGMMACRNKQEIQALNNGDFMGIFEVGLPTKIATIRWLHTDNNDTIQIGLEIQPGNPTAVSFTPDGKTDILLGLLLPEVDDIKQPPTLIADKGAYSSNRIFRIKQAEETYTIKADELIDNTLNYEQFSFKKIAD